MKFWIIALVAVTLTACSPKHSDKTGITGTGGGQGTVEVSGDLNKTSKFGGSDVHTAVYCTNNPKIEFAQVRLEAKSAYWKTVQVNERISFSFTGTAFPTGTTSIASSMMYSSGDEEFRKTTSSDCTATLSHNGKNLSGTVTCRGLQAGKTNKLVNVRATFDCGIVNYN